MALAAIRLTHPVGKMLFVLFNNFNRLISTTAIFNLSNCTSLSHINKQQSFWTPFNRYCKRGKAANVPDSCKYPSFSNRRQRVNSLSEQFPGLFAFEGGFDKIQ